METTIISVTFFLGVGLSIVAVVALFTRRGEGKGRLKLPGIELSGTGTPILFLFVGTVLIMSGFGWASSQKEVAAKGREVTSKERERSAAVRTKNEVVREAKKLQASLSKQVQLNRQLTARVPRASLANLRLARPDLVRARVHEPSLMLRREIANLPD